MYEALRCIPLGSLLDLLALLALLTDEPLVLGRLAGGFSFAEDRFSHPSEDHPACLGLCFTVFYCAV